MQVCRSRPACFSLTGDDIRLDDTGDSAQLAEQIFQRQFHIGQLSRNGNQSMAVGGDDGVDGQNVCLLLGKNHQQCRQNTGFVVQHQLEGDDPTLHHVLEGQNGVPIFIKCAAADVGALGGLVNSGDSG